MASILLGEASISKKMDRAMEKLEMGKPFAFPLLLDLDLLVSQIGSKIEDRNIRFSMRRKGKNSSIALCVKIIQPFLT